VIGWSGGFNFELESCFCSNYGKIVCVRQINLSMDMDLYVRRYFCLRGRIQMVSQSFGIDEVICTRIV
jgi:hypothetical protein